MGFHESDENTACLVFCLFTDFYTSIHKVLDIWPLVKQISFTFYKTMHTLAQTHTKASADCRIINIHHPQTSVLHTSDAIQNTWNNNEPSV